MKITSITCEHTRQVTQFNPVRFSISADLTEKDDPAKCAKDLQRLVLMITYKDDPKQRDHLIKSLCPEEKEAAPTAPVNVAPGKTPSVTTEAEAKEKIAKINDLKKKTSGATPLTSMSEEKWTGKKEEPIGIGFNRGDDEEVPNF